MCAVQFKGISEKGVRPSPTQLGHILAVQRLGSDPDLAAKTEADPRWHALPAGRRRKEVAAHLGLLGIPG